MFGGSEVVVVTIIASYDLMILMIVASQRVRVHVHVRVHVRVM